MNFSLMEVLGILVVFFATLYYLVIRPLQKQLKTCTAGLHLIDTLKTAKMAEEFLKVKDTLKRDYSMFYVFLFHRWCVEVAEKAKALEKDIAKDHGSPLGLFERIGPFFKFMGEIHDGLSEEERVVLNNITHKTIGVSVLHGKLEDFFL